jgi:hypothetical protein
VQLRPNRARLYPITLFCFFFKMESTKVIDYSAGICWSSAAPRYYGREYVKSKIDLFHRVCVRTKIDAFYSPPKKDGKLRTKFYLWAPRRTFFKLRKGKKQLAQLAERANWHRLEG